MTLLQQMEVERSQHREKLRLTTQKNLSAALRELIPNETVIVFGSLLDPGRFNEFSDIDLAFEAEPQGFSQYQLSSLLSERLGRPVDVVLLPECRFSDKIRRTGALWTRLD